MDPLKKFLYDQNKADYLSKLDEIGRSDTDLFAHCKSEYILGFNYVNTRRMRLRDRRRLYNEVLKDPEKINTNDIYAVMQTLLALYYIDELTVNFMPRNPRYDELADNIQNLAKFDYDEMDMDTMSYWVQWDRLFYGVGIRQLVGWDEQRQVPKWEVKDPLTRIPDPKGSHEVKNFRFMGFESQIRDEDLTAEAGFFDTDKALIATQPESLLTWVAETQPRALNIMPETIENGYRAIYYHYTSLKSKKDGITRRYLVGMTYTPGDIIKFEEIIPMNKAEKENPSLVQFPIVLNYYDPIRGDAFGVSIPDLIEDKQRARSKNFNLNMIKATYEALGGITLYNPFAVRNATDLETPTIGKKYVPVNPEFSGGRIDNIVFDTNMVNHTNPDSINSINALRNEQFYSTNIDATQMGIQGDTQQTATANQNIQLNANVKFQLKNRINGRGERRFRELRYKTYRVAFKAADSKYITLNTNRGIKGVTLKRKDFMMDKDPKIDIVSRTEKLAKDREDKINFMAFAPQLLADPETPKLSRSYIKRKLLKLNGQDRDEILEQVPPYYEELQAKMWAELIDADDMPPKINNMEEDHMTYLMIYSGCEDTDAKFKAIEQRKRALMLSMQSKMQGAMAPTAAEGASQTGAGQSSPVMTNQLANNVSSMMSNNAIQSANAGSRSVSQQNAM